MIDVKQQAKSLNNVVGLYKKKVTKKATNSKKAIVK
jgi:hypothetical protein